MALKNLLLVDDRKDFCNVAEAILLKDGHRAERAYSGLEALQILELKQIDLVLLDVMMPITNGLDTLALLKQKHPQLPVVVLTGDTQPQTVVAAMKLGAYDYLAKPLDWQRMRTVVKNGLLTSGLEEARVFPGDYQEKAGFGNVIGVSRRMRDVFRQVEKVVDSDTTIAFHGERGTGKKLLAQAIHFGSPRREKPFMTVNCAAMPENLLECELFGHEKNSVPGGFSSQAGKLELANGGTLVLDEITEMSSTAQLQFLRVLQDHKIEPIGGGRTLDIDVRVITVTNRNLEEEMKKGRFREELFYRINVFPITLPPLRERKEDIPSIVAFFIKRFHEKKKHGVIGVSSKAMDYLLDYHWPGNIRELENVIEATILNADNTLIQPEHLPLAVTSFRDYSEHNAATVDFHAMLRFSKNIVPLEEIEKAVLLHALKTMNYNMSTTASALGIGRTTLYRKVHKYGIPVPRLNWARQVA